jgi:hypothetical protein
LRLEYIDAVGKRNIEEEEEEEGRKKGGITYKGKRRRLYRIGGFLQCIFSFYLPFCPEAGNYKL